MKRLGDGAMAVFGNSEQAVSAALDAQKGISEIEVEGYRPIQRAGVHRGTPRKVKGDFLGVDVNIAARVGDAADGGEVLVSEPVREELDGAFLTLGPSGDWKPLCSQGVGRDQRLPQIAERPAQPAGGDQTPALLIVEVPEILDAGPLADNPDRHGGALQEP